MASNKKHVGRHAKQTKTNCCCSLCSKLTAPSKVKNEFSVPLTLATVTVVFVTDVAVADAARHCTLVALAHDDVAQSMSATEPVGVRSVPAKLRPLSVTDSPPDAGMLLSPTRARLATGASNVNTALPVPDTLATVIVMMLSPLLDADAMHCTVVPLTHADVAQLTSPTVAVGVKSSDAKASPLSVAVSPPLCCMLELPMSAELATGAVNTNKPTRITETERSPVTKRFLQMYKIGERSDNKEPLRSATQMNMAQ